MKYISTYENFNYQPTNEEFLGLFSAKTRNEYIKKGFENGSKEIEANKELQKQVMDVYQKYNPNLDEMKDAVDAVSGSDDAQIQSLEKELKADPVMNESATDKKTIFQKIIATFGKIWRLSVDLVHFLGALAMILLPFTSKLGATVITSGEASGNTSLTWYGGLILLGGLIAMIAFIWRKVNA